MGTNALLILLSMKPEYNAKIKLGILLAPIAFWKKIPLAFEYVCNIMPKIKVKKYQNSQFLSKTDT